MIIAAVKTMEPDEAKVAIMVGIKTVGTNYVQEANSIRQSIDKPMLWHIIAHVQRKKVKKAVNLFDMIEIIDSVRLAKEINQQGP